MRKIFRYKIFVIIGVLAVAIVMLSYITLQKQPGSGCINAQRCYKASPAKSDVLLEAFSRQFLSAVSFQ